MILFFNILEIIFVLKKRSFQFVCIPLFNIKQNFDKNIIISSISAIL